MDREYKKKSEHQLSKLWPKVRSILYELWPNEKGEDLEAVDSLIAQFEEVDPRSTSFRYPKDFKGNNSLSLNVPRVNLRNLAEVVGVMFIIFDGSSSAISEYQGYKNDRQNDYW